MTTRWDNEAQELLTIIARCFRDEAYRRELARHPEQITSARVKKVLSQMGLTESGFAHFDQEFAFRDSNRNQ